MTSPTHKIRIRNLSVIIWRNSGENGPWYSVQLKRSYKTGNGEWRDTDALGQDDLQPMRKLLDMADTWIIQQGEAVRRRERQFGTTIKKGQSVEDMANKGKEFVSDKPEELRQLAMSPDAFTAGHFFLRDGEDWKTLAGAYKRCGGPS